MSALKSALNLGDADAVRALASTTKELSRAAAGSKARVRCAAEVLLLDETAEGDARIRGWLRQKMAEPVLSAISTLVRDHEDVERFCDDLGENLVAGRYTYHEWMYCVRALTHMRRREALGYVLDDADNLKGHLPAGAMNAIARGSDIRHESERIERLVGRFPRDDSWVATLDWVLAKLGDEAAYKRLVALCLDGEMTANGAMRAAQALADIHKWDFSWGQAGTLAVQGKLLGER